MNGRDSWGTLGHLSQTDVEVEIPWPKPQTVTELEIRPKHCDSQSSDPVTTVTSKFYWSTRWWALIILNTQRVNDNQLRKLFLVPGSSIVWLLLHKNCFSFHRNGQKGWGECVDLQLFESSCVRFPGNQSNKTRRSIPIQTDFYQPLKKSQQFSSLKVSEQLRKCFFYPHEAPVLSFSVGKWSNLAPEFSMNELEGKAIRQERINHSSKNNCQQNSCCKQVSFSSPTITVI